MHRGELGVDDTVLVLGFWKNSRTQHRDSVETHNMSDGFDQECRGPESRERERESDLGKMDTVGK